MPACIEAIEKGASGNSSESERVAELESSAMGALANGFAASLAERLNAGTRRTAIATVPTIFTLNLIVVS
jgi:hypothetical protein